MVQIELFISSCKLAACVMCSALWAQLCRSLSWASLVPAVSKGCSFLSSQTAVLKKFKSLCGIDCLAENAIYFWALVVLVFCLFGGVLCAGFCVLSFFCLLFLCWCHFRPIYPKNLSQKPPISRGFHLTSDVLKFVYFCRYNLTVPQKFFAHQ